MSHQQTHNYDDQYLTVFAYSAMLKLFYCLLRYYMINCCTTLKTHVGTEIDLVCTFTEPPVSPQLTMRVTDAEWSV